jgi:uncharacterized protein YecT (DUF1311 family)
MKTKRLLITFVLLISMAFVGKTQTQKTIDSIKVTYQNCLDKGEKMLGCTYWYYDQMDSLLNVVYKMLRSKLDSTGKAQLKSEQVRWLSKRDTYFKKLDKELQAQTKAGEAGRDEEMIAIDQQTDYVRERVEALIRKQVK